MRVTSKFGPERNRQVLLRLILGMAATGGFGGDARGQATGEERVGRAGAERLDVPDGGLTEQQMFERTKVPVWDEARSFQIYIKNARQLRTEDVVLQQRDFSCGAAALATILNKFWGENVTETGILFAIATTLTPEELQDRIENGLTLTDLKRLLERFGYQAVLGRLPVEKLRESKIPLLVGITVNDFDHFVVVRGADERFVYLADPAVGKIRVPIADFEKQWQKNTVLVVIRPNRSPPADSVLFVTENERRLTDVNHQFLRSNVTGRLW
jgi:uncharacterized protein